MDTKAVELYRSLGVKPIVISGWPHKHVGGRQVSSRGGRRDGHRFKVPVQIDDLNMRAGARVAR